MLIISVHPFKARVRTHLQSTTFSLGVLNFFLVFCVFTEDTHVFGNEVVLSKLYKTL